MFHKRKRFAQQLTYEVKPLRENNLTVSQKLFFIENEEVGDDLA